MANKRKYPRLKDGVKVVCKVCGEEGEANMDVLDVGAGGLRLPVIEKLNPGTKVELSLLMPDEKDPFCAFGTVVWQSDKPAKTKEGGRYFETGVEFEKLRLTDKIRLIQYVYSRLT